MSDPDLNDAIKSGELAKGPVVDGPTERPPQAFATLEDLKGFAEKIANDVAKTVAANILTPQLIPAAVGEILSIDFKPLLASKTIAGLVVIAISIVAQRLGLPQLAPGDVSALVDNLLLVAQGAGWVLAFYGRITAKTPLK